MMVFWIFLNFFGLFLASIKLRAANPFQIYFFVWSLLSLVYGITADTWIPVSDVFFIFLMMPSLMALGFLFVISSEIIENVHSKGLVPVNRRMGQIVFVLQILVWISLPLSYIRATELAGGYDLFNVEAYTQLRSAMVNDELGYGGLGYFFVLSYVVTSLSVFLYKGGIISGGRFSFSFLTSFLFCYLATGRTFILFFLCLLIVPLILNRFIGYRGILFSFLILIFVFIFVSLMTAKGVSFDVDFYDNVNSFLKNLRSYTAAPLLAFFTIFDSGSPMDLGENSFRFFFSVFNRFGLGDFKIIPLVRDYVEVPDLTNVYTVYEPYFLDFSYFGFVFPFIFLMVHFFLYKKSFVNGGVWVFLYAASVYPLAMQFFQDQYFSLLSTWIQVCFWFWFIFHFSKRWRDD